jgi:hypothetical protein
MFSNWLIILNSIIQVRATAAMRSASVCSIMYW